MFYEIFKYKTKKGVRYLSKVPSKYICETTSAITDVEEINKNQSMISRLSVRANFNPWSHGHKLVVKKINIIKEIGKTNIKKKCKKNRILI